MGRWFPLLWPLGFSLSVWVSLRTRVTFSTSSERGSGPVEGGGDLSVDMYGLPFGFVHAKHGVSGEQVVYWLPILGNALAYAAVLGALLWLLHAWVPRPRRWVQTLTWVACALTFGLLVLESSIGSWRWVNPWEVTEVQDMNLSIGFPFDQAP